MPVINKIIIHSVEYPICSTLVSVKPTVAENTNNTRQIFNNVFLLMTFIPCLNKGSIMTKPTYALKYQKTPPDRGKKTLIYPI